MYSRYLRTYSTYMNFLLITTSFFSFIFFMKNNHFSGQGLWWGAEECPVRVSQLCYFHLLLGGYCQGREFHKNFYMNCNILHLVICYVYCIVLCTFCSDCDCIVLVVFSSMCLHCKDTIPKVRNNTPRKGIARLQSPFPHSGVCERFIYSHDRSAYSDAGK